MTSAGRHPQAERLVELARALTAATRAGRAEWSPTSRPGKHLYSDVSGSVMISQDLHLDGGYTLEVLDPDGQTLETLRAGIGSSLGGAQPVLAYQALADLHAAVQERGERADRVIDDLLSGLQRRLA